MGYWVDTDRYFEPIERDSFPLIHLTQKWEILELILKEGLKPNYCREYISNNNETKEACFPMISTSNISFDLLVIASLKSYGTLGIVLSKKWGEENGLNPVLYFERTADLTTEIIDNFKNISTTSKNNLENALNGYKTDYKSLLTKQLIKIFAHSKNYDGILVRNNILKAKNHSFGMEREWRKIIQNEEIPYFIVGDEINQKADYNKLLEEIRVDFSIDHLLGVIVETEFQKNEVIKIIKEKYNLNEIPDRIDIKIKTCTR